MSDNLDARSSYCQERGAMSGLAAHRRAVPFPRPRVRARPTWRNWQRTALVMRRLGVRVPPSAPSPQVSGHFWWWRAGPDRMYSSEVQQPAVHWSRLSPRRLSAALVASEDTCV